MRGFGLLWLLLMFFFIQISNDKGKSLLLPGDKENLAIQTRGGPEKFEVTGWVLVSLLDQTSSAEHTGYQMFTCVLEHLF